MVLSQLKLNVYVSEWIIRIYLHKFTNNEQEISILHKAASCSINIENFEFLVSEIQSKKKFSKFESAEAMVQWQWCDEFTPWLLHHDNDVKAVVSSRGANQPISKLEFLQCMKVE